MQFHSKNPLLFVAFIPDDPLKNTIQEMKYEVRDKFGSEHSLNAPPHVTLLSPFRLQEGKADELDSLLEVFGQGFEPVPVKLDGFSTFPPKVVFVDVEKTPALMEIQDRLEKLARSNPDIFQYGYDERPFHPHITLAFKDLTKSNFIGAWKHYRDKEFKKEFVGKELCLLHHNGENWEVVKRYSLVD